MRKSMILLGAAAGLAGCGQSADNAAANEAAANSAAAEAPRPVLYLVSVLGGAGKVDKDGNVVVSGKAYRSDGRYKAELQPATISGTTAQVTPTITVNDTGYAAPENWWDLSETIPNSQAVTSVEVKCGADTIATLTVPRQK